MSKHTPGPWHVGRNVILTRNETGPQRHIVDMCWWDEQGRADANLIAAAPDLLAALKALVDLDQRSGWHSAQCDAAIAAIAKAEGQS